MNSYNEQLIKIALDAIKHIDSQHALQEIYRACGKRYAEISSNYLPVYEIDDIVHQSGLCTVLQIDYLNNEFSYICNCGGVHWIHSKDFHRLKEIKKR